MQKTQLGVIFGSRSCEREVAIISAVQLMNHVDPERYDLIPVYIAPDGRWYTGAALRRIESFVDFDPAKLKVEQVHLDLTAGSGALMTTRPGKGLFGKPEQVMVARLEVCLIVMHGLHGEDGTLQGLLELANLPYTSTGVAGSAIGMDKILMKRCFQGCGFPVLPGCWFSASDFRRDPQAVAEKVERELPYPVFVKPANLGSSIGVTRANDREGLMDALELAFEYDRRVLVEQGLDHPIELNCSVLGFDGEMEASPVEMPISSGDLLDFGKKYLAGGGTKSGGMASLSRVLPAPIPDEQRDRIQALSKEIFRELDCKGVVRIDYMLDRVTDQLFITEINTIPGSLAFYLWEAAGVKYSVLIDRMVALARKAWEEKNARTFVFTSDILKGAKLGAKGAKGSKGSKGSKF